MHLKLPTLKYRRLRGDMIEVFKIGLTHNIYDPEVSRELRYYPKSNTRGNKYKLLNHTFHYDTRKYSFSARIVNCFRFMFNGGRVSFFGEIIAIYYCIAYIHLQFPCV